MACEREYACGCGCNQDTYYESYENTESCGCGGGGGCGGQYGGGSSCNPPAPACCFQKEIVIPKPEYVWECKCRRKIREPKMKITVGFKCADSGCGGGGCGGCGCCSGCC
jgi:hypothetical protein